MSTAELARSLVAAGSARLLDDQEGGIYLLTVTDNSLVEKLCVGDDIKSETFIASDVKENSSIPYLLAQEQGVVSSLSSPRETSCNHADAILNVYL